MDKLAQWSLVAAAWFLALAVAVLGYVVLQRISPPKPSDPLSVYAQAADGTARCPVTAERIVVAPDTPKVSYQGRVYYFSHAVDGEGRDARTRFLMNPEAYLHGGPALPAEAPTQAAPASATAAVRPAAVPTQAPTEEPTAEPAPAKAAKAAKTTAPAKP